MRAGRRHRGVGGIGLRGALLGAMLANAVGLSPARACEGRASLVEDRFESGFANWTVRPYDTGGLLGPDFGAYHALKARLPVDFDSCVDVVFPRTDERKAAKVVVFLSNHTRRSWSVTLYRAGKVEIDETASDVGDRDLTSTVGVPELRTGPGDVNRLRITARGPTLDVSVNGASKGTFRSFNRNNSDGHALAQSSFEIMTQSYGRRRDHDDPDHTVALRFFRATTLE